MVNSDLSLLARIKGNSRRPKKENDNIILFIPTAWRRSVADVFCSFQFDVPCSSGLFTVLLLFPIHLLLPSLKPYDAFYTFVSQFSDRRGEVLNSGLTLFWDHVDPVSASSSDCIINSAEEVCCPKNLRVERAVSL